LDQPTVTAILALQKSSQAIRHMLNSPAERWIIQHVHDGSMNIGNQDLGPAAPNGLGSKYLRFGEMPKDEFRAMPRLPCFTDGLCGQNENFAEQLFGEIPMLGCRPASDVCRRVESRHQHP